MNVLVIAPPILKNEQDETSWTTVPPMGYGGIENVVYSLVNGLIAHGCAVTLIGSPGSNSLNGMSVNRDVRGGRNINAWVRKNYGEFDVIHDHACGLVFGAREELPEFPYIATHHQTGKSPYPFNTVFLSFAQKRQAECVDAPVIRLPVILDNYIFNDRKEDFYLCMGRVSEFKGVFEAAALCGKLYARLVVAGPNWEHEYFEKIINAFPQTVDFVGEVAGLKKIDLLSKAAAVLVLSRFTKGLWGDEWCEPGATIVGESAASGTRVISSTNGCLSEIVVPEIGVRLEENEINERDVSRLLVADNTPREVYEYAKNNWDHISISGEYLKIFERVIKGHRW